MVLKTVRRMEPRLVRAVLTRADRLPVPRDGDARAGIAVGLHARHERPRHLLVELGLRVQSVDIHRPLLIVVIDRGGLVSGGAGDAVCPSVAMLGEKGRRQVRDKGKERRQRAGKSVDRSTHPKTSTLPVCERPTE